MSKGRIEQVGTPDDIYDNPATPFVFGFIGESSRLPVTIGAGQIRYHGTQIGNSDETMPAGEGMLFFRPYDIEITDGISAAIEGTILGTRRTAGTRHVELELPAGHRLEIELPPERRAAIGEKIAFRPKKWKLFPNAG